MPVWSAIRHGARRQHKELGIFRRNCTSPQGKETQPTWNGMSCAGESRRSSAGPESDLRPQSGSSVRELLPKWADAGSLPQAIRSPRLEQLAVNVERQTKDRLLLDIISQTSSGIADGHGREIVKGLGGFVGIGGIQRTAISTGGIRSREKRARSPIGTCARGDGPGISSDRAQFLRSGRLGTQRIVAPRS